MENLDFPIIGCALFPTSQRVYVTSSQPNPVDEILSNAR